VAVVQLGQLFDDGDRPLDPIRDDGAVSCARPSGLVKMASMWSDPTVEAMSSAWHRPRSVSAESS